MTEEQAPSAWQPYDLVYVDPETNTVVGPVEWSKSGNPKTRLIIQKEPQAGKEERRRSWRKCYPWGTYRSMKNVFKVDGKPRRKEPTKTLVEVIEVALREPYWD